MSTSSAVPQPESHPNLVAGILIRLATIVIVLAFNAALLFLAAGRFNWLWAWVYLGICLASMAVHGVFMLRTNPGTIAERGRGFGQMKNWDRIVSSLWGLALYLALPLVAGLDEQYHWSGPLGVAWHIAGAIVLALGLALAGWAMIANAYFSTAVRIQSDRGHTVCRTGPYRFVRHPGYMGFLLQSLGTPFLLGSLWALIPGIVAVLLVIVRTSFEDHILRAELEGYPDYMQEVRYRLIPGIW